MASGVLESVQHANCCRGEMTIELLSDSPGNRETLERGFKVLERARTVRVYFLGDAIEYLPGVAALECLTQRDVPCLCGNQEDMFLSGDWPINRDEAYRFSETRATMSTELLRTIESWPTSRSIQFPVGPTLMCHGSPDSHAHGCLCRHRSGPVRCSFRYDRLCGQHPPSLHSSAGRGYLCQRRKLRRVVTGGGLLATEEATGEDGSDLLPLIERSAQWNFTPVHV